MVEALARQAEALVVFSRNQEARRRIANQRKIIASLEPGSAAHRISTEVLLILLDSAHTIAEAYATLAVARRAEKTR